MLPPAGRRPQGVVSTTPAPAPLVKVKNTAAVKRKSDLGDIGPVKRLVTASEEAAFATIETELGGRQKLVSILSAAQLPNDLHQLVARLADPRNDRESLAKLAAVDDVSLARMVKTFQEAAKTRGQLIAIARISERIPDVAAAVMDDALPGLRVCPECLGARTLADPTAEQPDRTKVCGRCRGVGEVQFTPDHAVQKTALQLAGLLEKGGGTKVGILVQQSNNNVGTDSGSYDRLVSALDQTIYGAGRERLRRPGAGVVDAEVQDADLSGED